MIYGSAFIQRTAGLSAMTASAAAAGHTAAARTSAAKSARATAAEAGRPAAKAAGTRAAGMVPRMRSGRRAAEEATGRGRIHGTAEGRRGRTAAIAPAPAQSAEYHGENNNQDQNIHVCFNLIVGHDFFRPVNSGMKRLLAGRLSALFR